MKKRNFIRILSFSIAITIAFGIYSFKIKSENDRYILEIENGYSYRLDELGSAANNISTILNKARFATTPSQLSGMAAQLLTEAELSKSSLAQLPVTQELSSLNRFFSQVGNYAMAVSKNLIGGGNMTDKEISDIEYLSETAQKVAEIVNKSRTIHNNLEYWAQHIKNEMNSVIGSETLEDSLSQTEEELKDYPTLIYDGPYSDHLLEKEPALLKDTAETDKSEAHKTAAKWAETYIKNLDYAGRSTGKIQTFDFLGEGTNVSVTVKGGHVIYMRKEKAIEEIILTYNQALEKAKKYLEKMGITGMRETYYFESDGICTVNFAFKDGDTICYTDLIKVGVAMDDGEILVYEGAGFIANHKFRNFEAPEYTPEQAKKVLSRKLSVENCRLALIPTNATEEKRCYEFSCISADGQEILVYINTATLAEEQILVLYKSDGGILVK